MDTWKKELTSRVIMEDTCSIKAGILKIISEVHPCCFTWPFTCDAPEATKAEHKDRIQMENSKGTETKRRYRRSGEIIAENHFRSKKRTVIQQPAPWGRRREIEEEGNRAEVDEGDTRRGWMDRIQEAGRSVMRWRWERGANRRDCIAT